jgi:hypothetical protein
MKRKKALAEKTMKLKAKRDMHFEKAEERCNAMDEELDEALIGMLQFLRHRAVDDFDGVLDGDRTKPHQPSRTSSRPDGETGENDGKEGKEGKRSPTKALLSSRIRASQAASDAAAKKREGGGGTDEPPMSELRKLTFWNPAGEAKEGTKEGAEGRVGATGALGALSSTTSAAPAILANRPNIPGTVRRLVTATVTQARVVSLLNKALQSASGAKGATGATGEGGATGGEGATGEGEEGGIAGYWYDGGALNLNALLGKTTAGGKGEEAEEEEGGGIDGYWYDGGALNHDEHPRGFLQEVEGYWNHKVSLEEAASRRTTTPGDGNEDGNEDEDQDRDQDQEAQQKREEQQEKSFPPASISVRFSSLKEKVAFIRKELDLEDMLGYAHSVAGDFAAGLKKLGKLVPIPHPDRGSGQDDEGGVEGGMEGGMEGLSMIAQADLLLDGIDARAVHVREKERRRLGALNQRKVDWLEDRYRTESERLRRDTKQMGAALAFALAQLGTESVFRLRVQPLARRMMTVVGQAKAQERVVATTAVEEEETMSETKKGGGGVAKERWKVMKAEREERAALLLQCRYRMHVGVKAFAYHMKLCALTSAKRDSAETARNVRMLERRVAVGLELKVFRGEYWRLTESYAQLQSAWLDERMRPVAEAGLVALNMAGSHGSHKQGLHAKGGVKGGVKGGGDAGTQLVEYDRYGDVIGSQLDSRSTKQQAYDAKKINEKSEKEEKEETEMKETKTGGKEPSSSPPLPPFPEKLGTRHSPHWWRLHLGLAPWLQAEKDAAAAKAATLFAELGDPLVEGRRRAAALKKQRENAPPPPLTEDEKRAETKERAEESAAALYLLKGDDTLEAGTGHGGKRKNGGVPEELVREGNRVLGEVIDHYIPPQPPALSKEEAQKRLKENILNRDATVEDPTKRSFVRRFKDMILQPWTRARREKETMEKSVKHRQRETLGKVEGISAIQLTVGDAEMEAMGRVNEAHREEDRPHFIVTPLKMGMGIRVWVQPTLDPRDMISEVMLRRYDPKEFDMAAEEDFELVTHPLLQGRGGEAHKSKKKKKKEKKTPYAELTDEERKKRDEEEEEEKAAEDLYVPGPSIGLWVKRRGEKVVTELDVSYSPADVERLVNLGFKRSSVNFGKLRLHNLCYLWTKTRSRDPTHVDRMPVAPILEQRAREYTHLLSSKPENGALQDKLRGVEREVKRAKLLESLRSTASLERLKEAIAFAGLDKGDVIRLFDTFCEIDADNTGTVTLAQFNDHCGTPSNVRRRTSI